MWNRDRMTAAVIAGLLSSSALASIKVEFRTTGSFTEFKALVQTDGGFFVYSQSRERPPCHAPGTGLGAVRFVTRERGGDRNGSKRADGAALLSRSRSPIEQGVRIGVAIRTQFRDCRTRGIARRRGIGWRADWPRSEFEST